MHSTEAATGSGWRPGNGAPVQRVARESNFTGTCDWDAFSWSRASRRSGDVFPSLKVIRRGSDRSVSSSLQADGFLRSKRESSGGVGGF